MFSFRSLIYFDFVVIHHVRECSDFFFFFLTCSCNGAISKEWLLCVYWKLVGKAKEKLDQGICAVVYICFG